MAKQLEKVVAPPADSIELKMGMISAYNGGRITSSSQMFFRNLGCIAGSSKAIMEMLIKETYDLIILNSITFARIGACAAEISVTNIRYIRDTSPSESFF